MAQTNERPTLTVGNHIYLYRLLAAQIGCGKQTFLTRVEEALAADRMTAEDLGFESTRALLEELGEFVELKVFKGGRVYATIMAQPAWDEALATLEEGASTGTKGSGAAHRRGRGKAPLKPVKPRRVRRAAPPAAEDVDGDGAQQPDAGSKTIEPEAEAAPAEPDGTPGAAGAGDGESEASSGLQPEAAETQTRDTAHPTVEDAQEDPETEPGGDGDRPATEPRETPVHLTITYDPEEGQPEERPATDVGTTGPEGADRARAVPEDDPSPAPSSPPAAAPTTAPSARALREYPEDFAAEVYVPAALEALLASTLPYPMTATQALADGYEGARASGKLIGNRAVARFDVPLPERGLRCTACLKRHAHGTYVWRLDSLEFALL